MAGADVQLRPAKGIHIVYPHRISNFAISAETVDGRDLLMVSHGGFTLLGTTDDDFYGDLDSVDVHRGRGRLPPAGVRARLPGDPAATGRCARRPACGRRLFKWRRYEDELSRRYQVIDHARDGADGFVTIAGGKLSMYRLMAEETSRRGVPQAGPPGAVHHGDARRCPAASRSWSRRPSWRARCGIPALAAIKLQSRHGSRADDGARRGAMPGASCAGASR